MPRPLALLLATIALTATGPAAAQNLTLSPAVVPLGGKAGQTTTQTLTLTNTTSFELAFELEAQDVIVRDDKRVFLHAGDLAHSIAATAVFSHKTVVVPSKQARAVDVTLTLPADAEARAVVILFRGTTAIPNGTASMRASIGTLLTFQMSEHVSVASSELRVAPQTDTRNAEFGQTLFNDGTEPLEARGVAVVLDDAGKLRGRLAFDLQRLLPGEHAAFRAEYPGELPSGHHRVVSTFDYQGRSITRTAELTVP